MNNAEYHADRTAISKSGLDLIHKSPLHFKWAMENPREETAAMLRGTLVHTLALEPEKYAEEFAVLPDHWDDYELPEGVIILPDTIKHRRGKEFEAFKAAHEGQRIILPSEAAKVKREAFEIQCDGMLVITSTQNDEVHKIVEAVLANPVSRNIIENADAIEQSVFAQDFETGVKVKCRPDIRIGTALYDLKTTRSANRYSFARSVRTYRYHVQDAFYTDTCNADGIDIDQFGFIAVDTQDEPYQCTVFHRLSPEATMQGREEYRQDLRIYAECLEKDEWPGYPESFDELSLTGEAFNLEDM